MMHFPKFPDGQISNALKIKISQNVFLKTNWEKGNYEVQNEYFCKDSLQMIFIRKKSSAFKKWPNANLGVTHFQMYINI